MKREQKSPIPLSIQVGQWKRVLKWEDEPVLKLSLNWPGLPEDTRGQRRVDRYYRQVSDQWKARWEGLLYREACEAAQFSLKNSHVFRPWEGKLDYSVTFNRDGLLSIYQNACEYAGGAHGVTLRWADTWEPRSGTPRTLRSFFPPGHRWKRTVLEQLEHQAEARVAGGETLYFDDWRVRLIKEFDPDRFYLTEEGICIFYPLYAIAPYAEGIPVFTIPYPVPPQKLGDSQTMSLR